MGVDLEALYQQILVDIFENEYPKYDNLAIFVYEHLGPKINSLCNGDKTLRRLGFAEDFMQIMQIAIMKKSDQFFSKPYEGRVGREKTCSDLMHWSTTVMRNAFNNVIERKKKHEDTISIDDIIPIGTDEPDTADSVERQLESRRVLNICFNRVMGLKSDIHILLSWLSVYVTMLNSGARKKEAIHFVVDNFSDYLLSEMFDKVITLINVFEWLDVSENLINYQKTKLDRVDKNGGKIGDIKFKEFYMNKTPEASVCDWFYRVSQRIKKDLGIE